jgi:hypothetical protein
MGVWAHTDEGYEHASLSHPTFVLNLTVQSSLIHHQNGKSSDFLRFEKKNHGVSSSTELTLGT